MDKNKFLIELSESDRTSVGKEDFEKQSHAQKVFTTIWEIESEVNNGGFHQYFHNSSAETAHFAVEALNAIQAPKTADICSRAIKAAFPNGLPSVDDIQDSSENFSEELIGKLDQLDQEFYGYPHNLSELLYDFVVKHSKEFQMS